MSKYLTLVSALAALATAQTFTSCDPTKKSCPADAGLNQANYEVDLSTGMPKDWTMTTGAIGNGGQFRITKLGEGPTIQSNWHLFYGYVEAKIKAAPGAGIVSSLVLQSSDLDEIDWEWIGSDTAQAQSNYFGKGNTTTYDRGAFHPVTTPQTEWHTYAVDWKPDTTNWLIDGKIVRTLNYKDAVGGQNYPQTPCNIRIGNWVAGTPGNSEGTIEWAGGLTDFSKGPFDMYVASIKIINYNPGESYVYGDKSGSSASIQISGQAAANSTTSDTSSSTASSTGSSSSSTASGLTTPAGGNASPHGSSSSSDHEEGSSGESGTGKGVAGAAGSTVTTFQTSTVTDCSCTESSMKATGVATTVVSAVKPSSTGLAASIMNPTPIAQLSSTKIIGTPIGTPTPTPSPSGVSIVPFEGAASSIKASWAVGAVVGLAALLAF